MLAKTLAVVAATLQIGAMALSVHWYECPFNTTPSPEATQQDALMAECADVHMPLCHHGVCEDKSKKISVFVKRLRAKSNKKPHRALWMLQGGPGHPSVAMETLMWNAYKTSNESVSVYTMDHRGTGRSTYLHCEDNDDQVTEEDVLNCLKTVKSTFGNDAPKGFSVTSAATDVKVLVQSAIFKDTEVYVYGVSYGTYLVERLMHLAPSNVKGYILDSIQSEQFYTNKDSPYYSNWDRDVSAVVEQFFAHCDKDDFCKDKIGPKSKQKLQQTYLALDAAQTDCFDVLYPIAHDLGYAKPSGVVGQALYDWFSDREKRVFVPAYIFRLNRCNSDDQLWLQQITYPSAVEEVPEESPFLKTHGYSDIVYNNIVFSEIWQTGPSPSAQKLYDDSVRAVLSLGNIMYARTRAAMFCLYKRNQDPMCADYPQYDVDFTYERDKYWNKTAAIPPGTSVLMLAGALDPATPTKYARDERDTMAGGDKLLLEFPFANHGVLVNTPDENNKMINCGDLIVGSFLEHGGNLKKIDTSCMERIEKLQFSKWNRELSFELFGSDNPYNVSGVQVKLQSILETKIGNTYTTPLLIVALLLLVSVAALIIVATQNYRLRKQLKSFGHLPQMEKQPLTGRDVLTVDEIYAEDKTPERKPATIV